MRELPTNVVYSGNTKTKNGKIVSKWEVECIYCGRKRYINRRNHAIYLASSKCKYCSNKSNHPQGEYKGIRISFFNKYKLSANNRGIVYDIDLEYVAWLAEFQNYKCFYSGLDLKFNGDFKDITASIDRIDSSFGYIENNVCWVHKDINMMKQQFSEERFIELCKLVSDNKNK